MAEIVAPRPASTILLLRDAPARKEIEVFMMVRHYEIDFNSGALVFPGGSVDNSDSVGGEVLKDDSPGISKVARETAEIVDDDSPKCSPSRINQQSLQIGTLGVRARDGGVDVLHRHVLASARGQRSALPELIIDGAGVLPVG